MTVRGLNDHQALLVRRLSDRRSKQVVFLSHCLLNENTRYLGGASHAGCEPEISRQCVESGLGIVQMPCPEQHAWGGVLKRHLLLAYGLKGRHPLIYRMRGLLLSLGLFSTRFLYRRLARDIARQIADYLASGFEVVGVVGIDGSPSCGVNTTLDPHGLTPLCAFPAASLTVRQVNSLLRQNVRAGTGLFFNALSHELMRRNISIPYLAHDLFGELDGRPTTVDLLSRTTGPDRAIRKKRRGWNILP